MTSIPFPSDTLNDHEEYDAISVSLPRREGSVTPSTAQRHLPSANPGQANGHGPSHGHRHSFSSASGYSAVSGYSAASATPISPSADQPGYTHAHGTFSPSVLVRMPSGKQSSSAHPQDQALPSPTSPASVNGHPAFPMHLYEVDDVPDGLPDPSRYVHTILPPSRTRPNHGRHQSAVYDGDHEGAGYVDEEEEYLSTYSSEVMSVVSASSHASSLLLADSSNSDSSNSDSDSDS
ncbi:hypothetical protein BJ684DRAFT_15770, partial [Piptocephalis cylindrospora]